MKINNCTIKSNSAAKGGAIFGDYTTEVNNCTIIDNKATSNGGGICFGYRGGGMCVPLTVTNTKLNRNSAGCRRRDLV